MAEETNELTRYEESFASDNLSTSDQREETAEEVGSLKAQIEETRQQMGETIDAIQEKLSFSNISEQVSDQVSNVIETAKHAVYDETIGKLVNYMKNKGNEISGTSVVRMVKENPIPFVMIAAGAGILAYKGFAGKGTSARAQKVISGDSDTGQGQSSSILRSAQGKVSELTKSVGGAVGTAYESVGNVAAGTYEGIANSAGNVYSGASKVANRAYDKAGEYGALAQEQYDHHIQENPLAVGAVALAIGAAVGLAIPSTRYEGELMGEASQNLRQKAQDSAGELVEKAKKIASEAGEIFKNDEETSAVVH